MDRFDVHTAGFAEDPWQTYAELRREAPVYWSDAVRAYVLTKHADVVHALRSPDYLTDFPFRLNHRVFGRCLLDLDGPDHAAARRALAPVFGHRGISEVVDPIIADGIRLLFVDMPADGGSEFLEQLSVDLPYFLTTRLLGLPFEDREWLRPRVRTIALALELPEGADGRQASAAADELSQYIVDRLEDCDDAPPSGPLRELLVCDSPPWSGWSYHGSIVFMLLAGTETSTCVIANVVRALLLHDIDLGRISGDRQLVEAIVKETLRWDPPTHTVLRFARDDVTVRGVTIPRHSRVLLCLASANRDSEAFDDPDAWRPDRDSGRSVTFGAGAHSCLGVRAAQREVVAVLQAFAERAGGFAPPVEIGPSTGNSFRKPTRLHYRFSNQLQEAAP